MSGAQPEVALAVQMKQATEAEEINDEPQSASDIDDLVASHGFEFIDHSGDSSVDADVEDDGELFLHCSMKLPTKSKG